MKTINETFTDEEYAKLMRIKKHLAKISWHDLLLRVFESAEPEIIKGLKNAGASDKDINMFFPGETQKEAEAGRE